MVFWGSRVKFPRELRSRTSHTTQEFSARAGVGDNGVRKDRIAYFFMDTIIQPPRGVSGNLEKSKANELKTKVVNRGHR